MVVIDPNSVDTLAISDSTTPVAKYHPKCSNTAIIEWLKSSNRNTEDQLRRMVGMVLGLIHNHTTIDRNQMDITRDLPSHMDKNLLNGTKDLLSNTKDLSSRIGTKDPDGER